MIYLPELPEEQSLADFYTDYAAYKGITPTKPGGFARMLGQKTAPPMNPFLAGVLETTGGLEGKTLCEIGCSVGDFLLAARAKGARVSGVELDEQALKVLSNAGIPAGKELAKDARLDVACAFQLIEHLPDPGRFVAGLGAALVPDGRLLLALPNGGEADVVGPNWIGFRVDLEHLNYFSVATLSRLLARHDLYVEHFWTCLPANLPRTDAPSPSCSRLQRWLRGRASLVSAPPLFASGTFVLFVLARKAA